MENLEKELIFKNVRENLEKPGSFFENLQRSGKSQGKIFYDSKNVLFYYVTQ